MHHRPIRTADALEPSFGRALRAMLDAAYDGDFSDDDWAHALGGTHVWIEGADGIVSHGAVVPRTVVCGGQALRVGYVEAVATVAAQRRRGLGAEVMRHLGDLIRDRYELGVLSTGSHAFYAALGWERWRGHSFVDAPDGRTRTPEDDDGLMVLRTPRSPVLDLAGPIVADWRTGDVW